ncbi:PREDICTED: uncharacterized protein LOC109205474 isoform X1 [Nicotiana attenuata]|uniref:uncharacterized protein LOC109205474 isoform X1 n=1 Tax=Nicotiana attenuata TaxID=49451 RepID=UPI000904A38E|nr:PREDICTED: uncharacterized protein LOC109205474 isoform X1 [Nicotiana attenuata]
MDPSPNILPMEPITPPTPTPSPTHSPPHPPSPVEQDTNFQAELEAAVVYNRETRPLHAYLDGIKVFVQKEYERKIFLRCPPNLLTTSFRLRPTINSDVGKYAMLLLPTFLFRAGQSSSQRNPRSSQRFEPILNHMNFIIWNCRGAQSDDFRRNFRSLLDYNRPSLVVLLETHCQNHQTVKEDFNFTSLIEVAANVQSGGIAILWLSDVLHVEPVATTSQEIHCHIQVITTTAG